MNKNINKSALNSFMPKKNSERRKGKLIPLRRNQRGGMALTQVKNLFHEFKQKFFKEAEFNERLQNLFHYSFSEPDLEMTIQRFAAKMTEEQIKIEIFTDLFTPFKLIEMDLLKSIDFEDLLQALKRIEITEKEKELILKHHKQIFSFMNEQNEPKTLRENIKRKKALRLARREQLKMTDEALVKILKGLLVNKKFIEKELEAMAEYIFENKIQWN